MTPQRQLIVVWENGRDREDEILDLLADDPAFVTVGEFDVSWPASAFSTALGQLYGERLPSRSEKQRHCGTGPFLAVIVEDHDPRPGIRRTPRGMERVDTHIFDFKQEARRLTGGGHLVHATDTPEEFRRDLVVVAQMTEDELDTRGHWGRAVLDSAPDGAAGWTTVGSMLQALERRGPYCVVRNFETWDNGGPTDDHPDIDLMVMDVTAAANTIGATRASKRRGRVQYQVEIAGRSVNLDLRSPGDGYFPEVMAERLLHEAVVHDDGFFVPTPILHFESLVYHALVHRPVLNPDYGTQIIELAAAAGRTVPDLSSPDGCRAALESVALKPVLPRDPSVRFNDTLVGSVAGLSRRRRAQWIRSQGGRGLRRVGLAS